ncbi:MAG: sugar phosphate isomerase/epimerase family protein [Elusimicrobiota bacterium]
MKYSFMSFSCPELSLKELLDTAKRFGYDGIEPRAESKHNHGVEIETDKSTREKIKSEVSQSGIALSCIATSCKYSDPSTAEQNVGQTLKFIDLAGDVGVTKIRVFGGIIPKEITRDVSMASIVKSLSSVAEHAKTRGVDVCMETHDNWCDPKHVAEIMKKVNHPNIAVNWDIAHPVTNKLATIRESFDTLRQWIKHVHFHDISVQEGKKNELVPIGQGVVDHKAAVLALRELGYTGYLSGEWIKWEPWEKHLPREIAAIKEFDK